MQLNGKVLGGTTTSITTRKGDKLAKTRLKVLDIGNEVSGDVVVYWIDFIGDAALTEDEMAYVHQSDVTIAIRRIATSESKDKTKTYLNLTGGQVLLGGDVVQAKLQVGASKK